jgi:hypothetical protein
MTEGISRGTADPAADIVVVLRRGVARITPP